MVGCYGSIDLCIQYFELFWVFESYEIILKFKNLINLTYGKGSTVSKENRKGIRMWEKRTEKLSTYLSPWIF